MAGGTAKAVGVAISLLVLVFITWLMVAGLGWFFTGHVLFGLTIGLMIGMTKSSIVSTAMPLLFTFAGTSIVALSVGQPRTPEQIVTLGQQLAGFSAGATAGILIGILLQKVDIGLPLGRLKDS